MRTAKSRLLVRQKFALLSLKGNFADSESTRFQRLSASIGRFLAPRSQPRTSSSAQKDRHHAIAIDASSATIGHRKARQRWTPVMTEQSKIRPHHRRGLGQPSAEDASAN